MIRRAFLLGVVLAGTLAGEERLAWALADLVHAKPEQCQPVADQVRRGELSTLAAVNLPAITAAAWAAWTSPTQRTALLTATAERLGELHDLPGATVWADAAWLMRAQAESQPPDAPALRLYEQVHVPRNLLLDVVLTSNHRWASKLVDVEQVRHLAEGLLSSPGLSPLDRANLTAWQHRVAWIQDPLPEDAPPAPTHQERPCVIMGRITVDGRPAVGSRVLAYLAFPRILAGGGFASFISGVDAISLDAIVPLPPEAAAGRCDHDGRFAIPVEQGGPYVLSLIYQQRAVNAITDVDVRVGKTPWMTWERGLNLHQAGDFDLGDIAVTTTGSAPLPRPVLDVPDVIHLGIQRRGQAWMSHLRLANLGAKPLTIFAGKTDCGCSQLFADAKETPLTFPLRIAPGEGLPVFVKVTTTRLFPRGHISKRLLLTTDDPLRPASLTTLLFTLDDPFSMQPDVVRVEILADQHAGHGDAFLAGADEVTITKVDVPQPGVVAEILPGNRSVRITATSAAFPEGLNSFRGEARIELAGTITGPITMPFEGTILGRPAVKPARLAFGAVRHGIRLKRRLTITGVTADTVIRQVACADEGIAIISATITGPQVDLELEIVGPGSGTSRLTVTASSPVGILTIPITWTLTGTP